MLRVAFLRLAVAACAAMAIPAFAQPAGKDRIHSAAFWRDVCTGQRPEIARRDQTTLCTTYLSSFHDASDEYKEAGLRLFCPPEAMSLETMRHVFLTYLADFDGSVEFLPAGRAVLQSLMRAYPCAPAG
jgi:hypothetical protein